MATQLRIKRGTTNANAPSGLTAGEMAINLVDKKLYVGGTAGTNVIFLDSTSSVGLSTANTFTALNSFNAGISASALTVSGTITSTQGITFGSGTTFMAFVPKTAANDGGLWLRDGLFQIGGGVFASGNGNLQYNMNTELLGVYGYQTIDNAAAYQGARTGLTVKGGTGQSVPLFNVTRGGTSAVQVHQDGYLAIPVNTAPAIKIGTHDNRNLTLASIDGFGEIVQTGGANAQLNIRQDGGGSVSIGDYAGTLNGNYISVNDANSVIEINGGEIYLNATIVTPLVLGSGLSASGATFSGDITVNSMTVGRGGGGDYRNTAVGKDTLLENTGIGNVGMGTYALGANTSGSNKTAIGYAAGYLRGSGVSSTLTTGTGGIYIGYQARGSADTQTNEIVIGVDALGLGSNTAVIGATLQSAATIYGVLNLPSGLSAAGATFNGTVNIGTTALISAPSATALAIRSQIPAGTGVTPTIQIICPSAGYTLTNQIATQKVFDLPQDTITLQAATTYMFEGHYLLTTGTTSHTTSMSFVLTTATITNCTWTTFTTMPSALNTTVAGNATAIFNSVTGGVVNGSSANPNTMITFKGIMRVNAGGTMVPNIAFSAQPGGTNNVLIGSYLKFYPIGSNTIDFVGTAIG